MTNPGELAKNFDGLEAFITRSIPCLTVDKLKNLIDEINKDHRTGLKKAGRKQDLIDKAAEVFRELAQRKDLEKYNVYKGLVDRMNGHPFPAAPSRTSYGAVPQAQAPIQNNGYRTGIMGNPVPVYNRAGIYAQPSGMGINMLRWKSSPGWRCVKAVSELQSVPSVPEGANNTRSHKTVSFQLTPDILQELAKPPSASGSRFGLRLFCTSSDHYPSQSSMGSVVSMEFPYNSDIVVNSANLSFLKGAKGKPDTAAPVDIDALPGSLGLKKVPNIYQQLTFGHTGPTLNKKSKVPKSFYYQICLAEVWDMETLKRRVLSGMKRSVADVLYHINNPVDSDDVQVSTSTLGLRCPIGYCRMTTPIRSTICSHLQCCDLDCYMDANLQSPVWRCPTCDKETMPEQLFVDQYTQAILAACPEDVDNVIVEEDGEWHTENGKWGSVKWKAQQVARASAQNSARPSPALPRNDSLGPGANGARNSPMNGVSPAPGSEKASDKGKNKEVHVLIDSDDESDEPLADSKPVRAAIANATASSSRDYTASPAANGNGYGNGRGSGQAARATPAQDEIIDMTGLESDEEMPMQAPQPSPKYTNTGGHKRVRSSDDEDDEANKRVRPAEPTYSRPNFAGGGLRGGANERPAGAFRVSLPNKPVQPPAARRNPSPPPPPSFATPLSTVGSAVNREPQYHRAADAGSRVVPLGKRVADDLLWKSPTLANGDKADSPASTGSAPITPVLQHAQPPMPGTFAAYATQLQPRSSPAAYSPFGSPSLPIAPLNGPHLQAWDQQRELAKSPFSGYTSPFQALSLAHSRPGSAGSNTAGGSDAMGETSTAAAKSHAGNPTNSSVQPIKATFPNPAYAGRGGRY